MLTFFELFGAIFLFIWCGNGVPRSLVQHYTQACSRGAMGAMAPQMGAMDFYLNVNIIIQNKSARKMHLLWMMF